MGLWGRQAMPPDMAADLLFSRIKPVSSFSACWVWMGKPNENGYGIFGGAYRTGRGRRAHRRAYELGIGPIPEGLVLDHLCENRLCVNPLHLKPTTQQENIGRSDKTFAARNARKTHCKHGHELIGANVYIRPTSNGGTGRQCRTCKAVEREASRARSR